MSATLSMMTADLHTLVQELSKNNPDTKLIKNKTDLLGIPYSADMIILMSEVLVYISNNGHSPKKSLKKPKEKAI